MPRQMTVIYDGQCGFCRDFRDAIAWLDRRDRFDWVDLHQVDYDDWPVTAAEAMQAMQLVESGQVYAGFYAARRIARHVPVLWPFYVLFHVPGVPWIGERVYRAVAARRHCRIPTPG